MRISYIIMLILITLVVALCYRKRSLLCTPLFIFFLFFTLGVEVVADILKYTFDANNLWVYNLYIYLSFPCWFYWLTKKVKSKPPILFLFSTTLFSITILVENVQISNIWGLNSLSFFIGTVIFVLLFIIKIFKAYAISDEIIPAYQLLFYMAGLVFYVGFFFDILLYPTGLLSQTVLAQMNLDQIISRLINIFYYCTLVISILKGVPLQKRWIMQRR